MARNLGIQVWDGIAETSTVGSCNRNEKNSVSLKSENGNDEKVKISMAWKTFFASQWQN